MGIRKRRRELHSELFTVKVFRYDYPLSEKWDCVSIEPIYDESINGYVAGGYLLLSDSLYEICIIDSAASDFIDTIIIGSEDSSGDIDMLLETIP